MGLEEGELKGTPTVMMACTGNYRAPARVDVQGTTKSDCGQFGPRSLQVNRVLVGRQEHEWP